MTDMALLTLLVEKEIALSLYQYGCPFVVFKLSKVSGFIASKEVHPCFTLYSIQSTHSYISSRSKVFKWHTPWEGHPLAFKNTEMFSCFSLSEDKAKSAWIESSWEKKKKGGSQKIYSSCLLLWVKHGLVSKSWDPFYFRLVQERVIGKDSFMALMH